MRRLLSAPEARRRPRARHRRGDEGGFTLIEVVMASMVIMVAILSVAWVSTSAMSSVAFSQQSQTATGLANQDLEQIRALPFATLAAGLYYQSAQVNDLTSDTAVTSCSSAYCYGGETIPTTSTPPASGSTPLYPHKQSPTPIGHTTYTVATYVTEYNNTTSPNVLRVTAAVSWSPTARKGVPSSTSVQTLIFPGGGGCLTSTNHPYAAPCEASFFTSATDGTGGVTLVPDTTYGTPVSLTSGDLLFPVVEGTTQIDQVSTVTSEVQNSGVDLNFGSTTNSQGTDLVTESASSDRANTDGLYNTGNTLSQSATTYSATDTAGSSLSVTGSGGSSETGSAYATTTASTGSHLCYDFSDSTQSTSLPCGSANVTQAQALSAALHVKSGSDLGNATIASLGASSARTFLTDVSSAGTYCASTSGDGCVDSRATRTMGAVTLGALPANATAPLNWAGYFVQIVGTTTCGGSSNCWTSQVTTEVGKGTASPTSTATGTIKYWNGVNYTSVSVGNNTTVSTQPTVLTTGTSGGTAYTVKETLVSFNSGSTSTSDPDACTSPCTRKGPTTATSTSPKVVIDYQVTYGTETWGLTMTFDLGTLSASGTYGASPSGS